MEVQEHIQDVLRKSEKKIQVLNILVNFFNNQDLLSALVKTKVIHGLFKSNSSLDINKLDLFHVQYTDTLIDLFQKLKKSKELQYNLLSDEYYLNQDYITKLEQDKNDSKWLDENRVYDQIMAQKLSQLYEMLAFDKKDNTFTWKEVVAFSAKNSAEYYRTITDAQWQQLTGTALRKSYANQYITIESRLLTRLENFKFKIKFRCGLINQGNTVEVFEFRDNKECFAATHTHQLYLLEAAQMQGIDLSRNASSKNRVINELREKNAAIQEKLVSTKSTIPNDVAEVLKAYLNKISDVRFLDDLQNVDEQTNILRAMLNININQAT